MATTFTTNDIELLGYSEPKELSASDRYAIFEAELAAGVEKTKNKFLYLKSNCTIDHVRQAHREIGASSERTYVVKPGSLRLTNSRLSEIFGKTPIYEHEELVWNRLTTVFARYLESLAEVPNEEYFISPRSTDRNISNLESWMIDYMKGGKSDDNGKILVLSAHAGVGKTTLSRYLLRQLTKRESLKTIPIYVEAQHWGKLHLGSIDELWDVIDNSLRFFSSELSLREELFYHALQQGYLSFVFDGFDELCGHKTSPLDAMVVLQQLVDIAARSEARILVTTRTLYWSSEIESPPENVRVVELDSLNTQQAYGYFDNYFKVDRRKREESKGVYRSLGSGSRRPPQGGRARAQFVNLPLCVAMVAAYVRDGGEQISVDARRGLLEEFLIGICKREQQRKGLSTSAMDQLSSFQELAILDEKNINPEFEFELLGATNFDDDDVDKLIDHPFLDLRKNGVNKYCFKYDFLGPYFRALAIAKALDESTDQLEQLMEVMALEAGGKGHISEQLCSILEPEDFGRIARAFQEILRENKEAASFLFHVCRNLIDETQTTTKKELSQLLFHALVGKKFAADQSIQGWLFSGTLDRLDFGGVTFDHCQFENVSFRDCTVDERTRFIGCRFAGELEISPRKGWDSVYRRKCKDISPAAAIMWGEILGKASGSKQDTTLSILRVALGKFWYHGRPKGSMRLDDWNKGTLRKLGQAQKVMNVMLKVGLVERITISGVSEGGILFDRNSMNDLRNFMDNQQMQGKIREMFKLLMEDA